MDKRRAPNNIGRSFFLRIVSRWTHGKDAHRGSLDYIQDIVVHANIANLSKIIAKEVKSPTIVEILKK